MRNNPKITSPQIQDISFWYLFPYLSKFKKEKVFITRCKMQDPKASRQPPKYIYKNGKRASRDAEAAVRTKPNQSRLKNRTTFKKDE